MTETRIPSFYRKLLQNKAIRETEIIRTNDGFVAVNRSLSDILATHGIDTFPGEHDQTLECRYFFDDWYLYCVPGRAGEVYSLFKMREQEFDAACGRIADGDMPGVTVSFISFQTEILENCLLNASPGNRKALGREINRVVAYGGQKHHPALKAYFLRVEAEGAYLIAELYTRFLASLAVEGILDTPIGYKALYPNRHSSKSAARLPDFIDSNNQNAGHTVCDHERIYLKDPANLSQWEKLAILATHTADTSFDAFACEVRFHAIFLFPLAKIRIPFLGCPYASAIRADMALDDKEFEGPAPYHNPHSRMMKKQMGNARRESVLNTGNSGT